ncbi:hypothetical protein E3N88_18915 [Mikania micrantha]|uniref:Uncharacterized protein n=1 Tax=Mikania micrantha TaxID=192012 RepID=A0A5N6NN42_9ASTR|nr:hypothetical protein E3N88_18915 [Mikania micrantha]
MSNDLRSWGDCNISAGTVTGTVILNSSMNSKQLPHLLLLQIRNPVTTIPPPLQITITSSFLNQIAQIIYRNDRIDEGKLKVQGIGAETDRARRSF